MRKAELDTFATELQRAGIASRHVRRAVTELREHYADLVDAAIADGHTRDDAEAAAMSRLGDLANVSRAYLEQPALRSWAHRWPHVAIAVYPLACVAALPAAPFIAGARHRDTLLRWTIGLLSAGIVTLTLLLVLQLTILFA